MPFVEGREAALSMAARQKQPRCGFKISPHLSFCDARAGWISDATGQNEAVQRSGSGGLMIFAPRRSALKIKRLWKCVAFYPLLALSRPHDP